MRSRPTPALLFLIPLLTGCAAGSDEPDTITDPSAPATITALFGGTLQADGQRVIRDPSPEEAQGLGAQPGDQLETVHFKTLSIEGGPTLVFHATYIYSNGMRQECRACTMTLSAAAFAQQADGTWKREAFKPRFADVSAAYEELPVKAIPIGNRRWLLEHESCFCGAGGDCMCDKTWYALDVDPGWLAPLLEDQYHYSYEDDKAVYGEELELNAQAGEGNYPDVEVEHSFTVSPMARKARASTRVEKTRYRYDPAEKRYIPAES